MDLHTYSTILTVGIILTFLASLVVALDKKNKILNKISSNNNDNQSKYYYVLKLIAIVSSISTLGALTYQYGYSTPVCILCWWQRIFMFPVEIIMLIAIIYKTAKSHLMTFILSGIGFMFASYHYYYHFKGYVLGQIVSLPCDVGGLLPACTENNGILVFGFATIPFLSLLAFASILLLSYKASTLENK